MKHERPYLDSNVDDFFETFRLKKALTPGQLDNWLQCFWDDNAQRDEEWNWMQLEQTL